VGQISDGGISTGLLTIASIGVATLVIGAAFGMAIVVSNQLDASAERTAQQLRTDVIILTTNNVTSESQEFMVYVKNTGEARINFFDVDTFFDKHFVINDGSSDDYSWNVTWLGESGNNNAWDPTETIAINIYLPSGQTVGTGVHEVMVSAVGAQDTYQFAV